MTKNYFSKYKSKIKTIEDLIKIFNKKNLKNKTVMCHGVFDLVHPGHIRHLAYAKSKADILVVSLTADRHIKKGIYRPHVPENLRALNLAAFEMVDFVIIDKNSTPLKNLSILKPDFFAKGFEYTSTGLPKATRDEQNEVNKYGGQMIFTPGDYVFSSSRFLDFDLPKLDIEKLNLLMENNSITFDLLRKSLDNMSKFAVHVVGDTIIDSYTRTKLIGGQTKTPTLSVLFKNKDDYVGGAGIVAKHLSAAGAKVTFTTVLGDDPLRKYVENSFKNSKIKLNAIVDKTRPTTNKNVIVADNYRLLKVDKLDNTPISKDIFYKINKSIKNTKVNSVIFSDFRHGIFNKSTIKGLSNSINKNVFKVADSQVATRWGNISEFQEFDLITPNEKEARFTLGDQDSSIGILAKKIQEKTKSKFLILKLGERGALCVEKNNKNLAFNIGSFAENVVDAVGAGDAFLAYATLIYLKTKSLVYAGIIGSLAASCECEVDGNLPIKKKEILSKIDQVEKILKFK